MGSCFEVKRLSSVLVLQEKKHPKQLWQKINRAAFCSLFSYLCPGFSIKENKDCSFGSIGSFGDVELVNLPLVGFFVLDFYGNNFKLFCFILVLSVNFL